MAGEEKYNEGTSGKTTAVGVLCFYFIFTLSCGGSPYQVCL